MRISQLTYRSAVFARDGYWCSYCSTPLTLGTATVDHVTPLAQGGRNHPDNMVIACRDCNGRKAALSLIEFLTGEPERDEPRVDKHADKRFKHQGYVLPFGIELKEVQVSPVEPLIAVCLTPYRGPEPRQMVPKKRRDNLRAKYVRELNAQIGRYSPARRARLIPQLTAPTLKTSLAELFPILRNTEA